MLIRRDVTNPRAEIARQTGKEVFGFRWLDDQPEPTTTYSNTYAMEQGDNIYRIAICCSGFGLIIQPAEAEDFFASLPGYFSSAD